MSPFFFFLCQLHGCLPCGVIETTRELTNMVLLSSNTWFAQHTGTLPIPCFSPEKQAYLNIHLYSYVLKCVDLGCSIHSLSLVTFDRHCFRDRRLKNKCRVTCPRSYGEVQSQKCWTLSQGVHFLVPTLWLLDVTLSKS